MESEKEESRRWEDTQQDDISKAEETVPGKDKTTDRTASEMDTEGGGEARQKTTEGQFMRKKDSSCEFQGQGQE